MRRAALFGLVNLQDPLDRILLFPPTGFRLTCFRLTWPRPESDVQTFAKGDKGVGQAARIEGLMGLTSFIPENSLRRLDYGTLRCYGAVRW